jgi:hypothetical protein
MLPYLHHESSTVYRRAVCRIAIAFIARLYKYKQYTYADLAALAQECVVLLESTKPKCGPEYYENRFARLEIFATILRDWHAKKAVVRSVADLSPNPTERGDVEMMEEAEAEADELEETMELLKRHTI